jgi:hypothetical protein
MPPLAEAVVLWQWILGQFAWQWDGEVLVVTGDATVCNTQTDL